MASESENKLDIKLDYIEDTKSLIRQSIMNKGIPVTDDITFRSYADLINNMVVEKDQSDATVLPSDMVAGKVAYNNNEKVVGILNEYSALNSDAIEVLENGDDVIGKIQTDSRTLLAKDAKISVSIDLNDISTYKEATNIVDDILDIN